MIDKQIATDSIQIIPTPTRSKFALNDVRAKGIFSVDERLADDWV